MSIPKLYKCSCGEIVPHDPEDKHFKACGGVLFALDEIEIRDHLINMLEIENAGLQEQAEVNTARLTNYAMQVNQHERNITRLEETMEAIEKELQLLAELTSDKQKEAEPEDEPSESGHDINHSQEAKVKMVLGVVAELEAKERGYHIVVCPKCGSERLNNIRTPQCSDRTCIGIMVKKEG